MNNEPAQRAPNLLTRELRGYPVWGWMVFVLIVTITAWDIWTGNALPTCDASGDCIGRP